MLEAHFLPPTHGVFLVASAEKSDARGRQTTGVEVGDSFLPSSLENMEKTQTAAAIT